VVPLSFEDFPNKYKAAMLKREYMKYVVDNHLYTADMEKALRHLRVWNWASYLSIPVKRK
jgi:hypothetical protein